jgi:hypothetical protein
MGSFFAQPFHSRFFAYKYVFIHFLSFKWQKMLFFFQKEAWLGTRCSEWLHCSSYCLPGDLLLVIFLLVKICFFQTWETSCNDEYFSNTRSQYEWAKTRFLQLPKLRDVCMIELIIILSNHCLLRCSG